MYEHEALVISEAFKARGMVASVYRQPGASFRAGWFGVQAWRLPHSPGVDWPDLEFLELKKAQEYIRWHCLRCDREMSEEEVAARYSVCNGCADALKRTAGAPTRTVERRKRRAV